MAKKKTYPEIKPKYIKDAKGKAVGVCLPNGVYESILGEISTLKAQLRKQKKPHKGSM
jgi:hypothetical protein